MNRRRLGLAATCAVIVAAFGLGLRFADAQPARFTAPVRFATLAVYVQSAEPLAAWQFELTEASGAMTVVGIENGDSDAYAGTPHYDLEAVQQDRADRIVVADFSLADRADLPAGRTRVATVHVRLTGPQTPEFNLELITAGNAEGQAITADAEFELLDGRAP